MYLTLEIAFLLIQLVLIAICIRGLKKITKRTMYSYKLISVIGGILFFSVCFLTQLIWLLTWPFEIEFDLYHLTGSIVSTFTSFAGFVTLFILPPFGLFLFISNLVLLKKEGKSLPNLLGFLLFLVLIVGSAAVIYSYDILDQFMNVHSYEGYCFSLWFEGVFAIIISYFECLLFATFFVSFKARRHVPKFNKDYLIILGCYVRSDSAPGGLLRRRIDRALEFSKFQKQGTKKDLVFVPSGGKGSDESVSEAASMKNYLLKKHIPKSSIIIEDKSATTLENFRFSKEKIGQTKNVAFATSGYHVFRAGVIATNAGFKNIEGIGAKSPWYYHDNALVREFIANLKTERRMHLKNIATLVISHAIIVAICYFLDIL